MSAAVNKTDLPTGQKRWTYEEICGRDYRMVADADCFVRDEKTGLYTDLRDTEAGVRYLYDNAVTLKVSGIIKPNEDAVSAMLTGSVGYTSLLTEELIRRAAESDAVKAQQADPDTDIFTGLPFKASSSDMTDEQKQAAFKTYVDGCDEAKKAALYIKMRSLPGDEELNAQVQQIMGGMTRADMERMLSEGLTGQTGMNAQTIAGYLAAMSDEDMTALFRKQVEEQVTAQYAAAVTAQLAGQSTAQLSAALDAAVGTFTAKQCAAYYDKVLEFADTTYDDNLQTLGCVDLDSPSAIDLYTATFAGKDVIVDAIAAYNDTVEELSQIRYTDYVGLMMSSVTTIIDAIGYVLIGFVSISLIVSSIMIGVITLISVQERTKEIGILRAIGASKRDVSGMFNAETMIIGFSAGLIGVLVTVLLCIPINLIVHSLTGIGGLSAFLPLPAALLLIAISVLLTLISGLIPSRSAAKKDPVIALRTE